MNSPEINKPKKEIVSSQALDSFIGDIERYDREHDPARKTGGFLAALMMGHMDDTEGVEKIKEDIENSITVQELFERNVGTLQKIGLDLESPNKKGDIDMNEQYVSGEVMVHLFDKDSYVDFLKSLNKDNVIPSQRKLLEIVTRKITNQIQLEYKLDENGGDERLLEIFSGLREIISEYERLGLEKQVEIFKDYLEYMDSGYLREYILVKNNDVFGEIGEGFNLSTFQRDATYKYYLDYWQRRFFDVLEKVQKNPEAGELVERMIKHAKESITFAESDNMIEKYSPGYLDEVRRGMAEVKARLENL